LNTFSALDDITIYDHQISLTRLFRARVELLVSHRVSPRVADRGMLARYGGYWGNKIPGADQNQYRCLAVDRAICKG